MNDEAGFVLHSHPWKETSLIVELFLRERGRISVVAKGARRPTSALRPVLLQFQPIEFRLAGRGELRTLTRAEWVGGLGLPKGRALWFAFYLNELLMRLLAREDPHPQLFDAYVEALHTLAEEGASEQTLRRFEWQLLQETGYAPDLFRDHRGLPLDASQCYRLESGQWVPVQPARNRPRDSTVFDGAAILHMAAGRYDAPGVPVQAKRLARLMIGMPLDGASLHTRRILMDLQALQE